MNNISDTLAMTLFWCLIILIPIVTICASIVIVAKALTIIGVL